MRLLGGRRLRYLQLGALLRLFLLLYGLYQDAHSPLPYTDIDYSVFLGGARGIVQGCPLEAAVPLGADPLDATLSELQAPPLAPVNGCAQGWLSIGARYILAHEEILNARSGGHQSAEESRQSLGEDAALSLIEPGLIETVLLPVSFAVLKPILKPLAAMGNPYARATYRYTPILAILLAPGAWFGGLFEQMWGKLLFAAADLVAAILMWDIVRLLANGSRDDQTNTAGVSQRASAGPLRRLLDSLSDPTHSVGLLWLLNPFPAQIATRGSCESIMSVLVLAFASTAVRAVQSGEPDEKSSSQEQQTSELSERTTSSEDAKEDSNPGKASPVDSKDDDIQPVGTGPASLPALPLPVLAAPVLLAFAAHMKLFPVIYGIPVLAALLSSSRTRSRWLEAIGFAGSSAYAFLGLSGFVWLVWGNVYLQESLFYHLTRSDHRHNFSPYFLPLHLLHTPGKEGYLPELAGQGSEMASKLSSFIPQLALVIMAGWRVGKVNIVAGMAIQTLAFVALNKVSTSQYFIWYLHFLPILMPWLRFSSPTTGWLVCATWALVQGLWLSQAYLLEFQAQDVFVRVWLASLVYVAGNVWVMERLLDAWRRGRMQSATRQVEKVSEQGSAADQLSKDSKGDSGTTSRS